MWFLLVSVKVSASAQQRAIRRGQNRKVSAVTSACVGKTAEPVTGEGDSSARSGGLPSDPTSLALLSRPSAGIQHPSFRGRSARGRRVSERDDSEGISAAAAGGGWFNPSPGRNSATFTSSFVYGGFLCASGLQGGRPLSNLRMFSMLYDLSS